MKIKYRQDDFLEPQLNTERNILEFSWAREQSERQP